MEKIVCVSDYFDPINTNHIEYCKNAKVTTGAEHLIVIVKDDGQSITPLDERIAILKEFWFINRVIGSIDTDGTVCKTLESIQPKPDYFCNGGDQEALTCKKLNITIVDVDGLQCFEKERTIWQRIWDGVEYLLYNHI
jgi:glycerol-3-phosphate cytidylyltransferase-like family protein